MTVTFTRGKQRFEVKRAKKGCAGYVDGVLSVTGPNAPTVTRVLLLKHVRKSPVAQVICFGPKLRAARPAAPLAANEPDLAG